MGSITCHVTPQGGWEEGHFICYEALRKKQREGVYIVPLCHARAFLGQPFLPINKQFFQLERALPLANTFMRAFMQTPAYFVHKKCLIPH